MNSWVRRLDDWIRPVAPAERLAALRIFVGAFALVYVAARGLSLASVAHQAETLFAPVGPVKLLQSPLPPALVYLPVLLCVLLGVPFVLGYRFRLLGPTFAAFLLWVTSYRNSFGMIFHTENLFVLHVALLSVSDAARATSLDARARSRRGGSAPEPSRRYGAAIVRLSAVTALAYVLAGWAKLRISGHDWLAGEILLNHIAHDNLRKALLGDGYSVIGGFLVAHAWLFKPFAVLTIVFEFGAPLALLSTRLAKLICGGLWLFHVGVLLVMWILFPYPLSGIAFLSFFRPERAIRWAEARLTRWREQPTRTMEDPA